MCKWIKQGKPCHGQATGRCPDRHEYLESELKVKAEEVTGAATSAKALDVAVLEEDIADIQDLGFLRDMRVVAAFDSADGALGKGAVLVDSGANEVVRPLQKNWLEEIWRGENTERDWRSIWPMERIPLRR